MKRVICNDCGKEQPDGVHCLDCFELLHHDGEEIKIWGFPTDHGGVDYYLVDDGGEAIKIVERGIADGGLEINETFSVGGFLESVLPQEDFLDICKRIKERRPMLSFDLYVHLAQRFIKERAYEKKDFVDLDVSNALEGEVSEFIDSISGTLDNYEDFEWEYKNSVYEAVCRMLEVSE